MPCLKEVTMLDVVLRDSRKRLYLQRKFRLEEFKTLFAPETVMDEAVRLLTEAESRLDQAAIEDALSVFSAYVEKRRSDSL